MTDPLLDWNRFPPFDRIETGRVEATMSALLAESERELERLERELRPDWAGLMAPLERLGDRIARTWGVVRHLHSVRNSPELRAAHDAVQPLLVRFRNRMRQSRPIYDALCALRDGSAWQKLDEAQRRIVADEIRAAERGGVGLEGEPRERFNTLVEERESLKTRFSNNVLDSVKAWSLLIEDPARLDGIPAAARELYASAARAAGHDQASAEAGPWRLGLDLPAFQPVLQHARDRSLREQCYRAYVARAAADEHDNTPLIRRILQVRAEIARLLGFHSYAELSLADKMAGTVDRVDELLEQLLQASRPAAERDLEELRELASAAGAPEAEDFRPWDQAFWAERLREQRFGLKDEELRPYFALPRVLDALCALSEDLFGIRVSADDGSVPVWHQDVRFFRVYDSATGAELAACYLDPYSRPEDKRGGAWMDDCVGRSALEAAPGAALRLPVAYLVCNQTPPVGGPEDRQPSLMSFREVETLFHEFGHALQHMLTTVDHGGAAGISGVEWDAVEICSQFMENWCYHRPVLVGMARHHRTGEPLPEHLVQRLLDARSFRAGSDMLRQLNFAMLDLELYHRFDADGDQSPIEVQRRIAERCAVLPPLAEDRSLCSFMHIFSGGYSAGYYSYKWAELLSADCFAAFEEAGVDDEDERRALGRRFRDTFLALGGGRHPMDVFRDFRGREPSPEPLLRQRGLAMVGS